MSVSSPTFAERAGRILDGIASAISPGWGARRQQDRILSQLAVKHAERVAKLAYHEDTADGRDGGRRWIGSQVSMDDMLEEDLQSKQEHSRELYRDDAIGGLIDLDLEHVVGTGLKIQAKPDPDNARGLDLEKIAGEFERVLKRWSKRADSTGKKSLWKLSRLVWRCFRVDGECLTVLSDVMRPLKPIPLAVEVVDIWRLATPPEQANNPRIRLGVEYDADVGGEIIAYWIRKSHPYDSKASSQQFARVTADRVCHLFDPLLAEQSRGLPWMSRVIQRIRDGKDLDFAGIVREQIQACFAAFVRTKSGNPLKKAEAAATVTGTDGKRLQEIRPGAVHYLGDDEVTFSTPPAQSGLSPLQDANNRRIAAGMNTPYEFLMRDWRGLSFAGGRLVLNGAKLPIRSGQKMMAEEWFAFIYARVITEAVVLGKTSLPARIFNQDPDGWLEHKCTPPRFSYSVNPAQEIAADTAEVDANFVTLEEKIAERQGDLEDVLAQRGKEKRMLRDEGLLETPTATPASKPKPAPKQVST